VNDAPAAERISKAIPNLKPWVFDCAEAALTMSERCAGDSDGRHMGSGGTLATSVISLVCKMVERIFATARGYFATVLIDTPVVGPWSSS